MTNDACRTAHQATGLTAMIVDSKICTLSGDGMGNCMGDSGGPLSFQNQLAGLVSWGIACAQGHPDVYTRTSSFVGWVNTNMA